MKNPHGFRLEKIALKDLFLWDENARFPDKYFSKTDEELIEYFLSRKDFKFKELAEAIVKDFDLPQLEKLVVYDTGEKLVVLEGNRRLTVYKLLLNPDLVTKDAGVKSFFENLHAQVDISETSQLECLITDNKEQGLRYIDRKHANGNNEVGWGDTERAHYNKRRGNAKQEELFKIALAKIIKDLDLPEQIKEQVLGRGYVTTFYRIVTSGPSSQIFGLKLNDKDELEYSDPDFKEKLKVIILNVLKQEDFSGQKINSRSMNKNEDIEKYLKSITNDDFPKVNSEVQQSTSKNIFGQDTVSVVRNGGKRATPKTTTRNYLIPKTCVLQTPQGKINNIYRELRDDLLLDDSNRSVPNAVGVLFRVFLEISLDYVLDKDGQTVSPNDTVSQKIPKVVNILKSKGGATDSQMTAINKVASSTGSSTNMDLLSIENFHQYVHSYKEQPTSSALKLKWDNLQDFFVLLWEYSNKNQKKP